MAASAVAMLSCAAAGAQAQTNPALVDLPAYLAYVAQHPTRLFGVEITSQARGYVSGALVSPAYGGGTRLDAWLNKSGHNLQADAGLQRDPRKLSSPDEVEAYARYDYGMQACSSPPATLPTMGCLTPFSTSRRSAKLPWNT